ncbi:MAG: hypothetical protein AB7U38_09470 [Hyphomicrobiales bacterium]
MQCIRLALTGEAAAEAFASFMASGARRSETPSEAETRQEGTSRRRAMSCPGQVRHQRRS